MEKHASLLITAFLSGLCFSAVMLYVVVTMLPDTHPGFTCLPGDCWLSSGLLYTLPIAVLAGLVLALMVLYGCRVLCTCLFTPQDK